MELLYIISELRWGYSLDKPGGIGLGIGPIGPRFLVLIGHTLWVLKCTVRGRDAVIYWDSSLLISCMSCENLDEVMGLINLVLLNWVLGQWV